MSKLVAEHPAKLAMSRGGRVRNRKHGVLQRSLRAQILAVHCRMSQQVSVQPYLLD